jgi:hypothetical protein
MLVLGRLTGMAISIAVHWRKAVLFLLAAMLLHGNSFAQPADRGACRGFILSLGFDSGQPPVLTHTPVIPGERAIYADFDGDHQSDLAKGYLVENRYEIFVWLSARSHVIVLHSPVELAGFTLHAFDINHDSYQDVVATSPTEPRPLAVWLGDGVGNFKSADRNLFETDGGFTGSPGYQNACFQLDQDSWTEPLYPVCEPAIIGGIILQPAANASVPFILRFYSAQDKYYRASPRSPPADFLLI